MKKHKDPITSWTLRELWDALAAFEEELKQAGLADNTVETYVGRSATFLRWLAGEYRPQGPRV
jgi:hypothetical protein